MRYEQSWGLKNKPQTTVESTGPLPDRVTTPYLQAAEKSRPRDTANARTGIQIGPRPRPSRTDEHRGHNLADLAREQVRRQAHGLAPDYCTFQTTDWTIFAEVAGLIADATTEAVLWGEA